MNVFLLHEVGLLVLHGCESCCLILKDGQTLRVFENEANLINLDLRKEITEEWRKIYEDLHNLYSSANINKRI
jgi:hypothetical protein